MFFFHSSDFKLCTFCVVPPFICYSYNKSHDSLPTHHLCVIVVADQKANHLYYKRYLKTFKMTNFCYNMLVIINKCNLLLLVV